MLWQNNAGTSFGCVETPDAILIIYNFMEIKIESSSYKPPKELTKEELTEFIAMFKALSNTHFKRQIILLTKNLFIVQNGEENC